MDKRKLITSVDIQGVICEFNTDFRDIIDIMSILSDPDLLEVERIEIALEYFYKDDNYKVDIQEAVNNMIEFIALDTEKSGKTNSKPLFSWDKDFNIIIAPINKILQVDVRSLDYLHWWTFLSAFMEIGDCTFSTYVSIRDKLNRGKKLEKYEERIYRDNRDKIILKPRVDSTTQALLDEVMGV